MFVYVRVCMHIYTWMYKVWSLVLTPQEEKRKENRLQYSWGQKSHNEFMIPVWYFRPRAPNFVFHLHNRETNKTASTLARSEVETTSRPVCNLHPTVSPVHFLDRTFCSRITWVHERHTRLRELQTAIRHASFCWNCTSSLFSNIRLLQFQDFMLHL